MDITGRLIKILPEVRGESQRGPWVKGGFVIETEDTYPRQVAFTLFGEDRLAMVNALVMNAPVVVTFSPESREYKAADVDLDGGITSGDARMILRAAVGLEDPGDWVKA